MANYIPTGFLTDSRGWHRQSHISGGNSFDSSDCSVSVDIAVNTDLFGMSPCLVKHIPFSLLSCSSLCFCFEKSLMEKVTTLSDNTIKQPL